MSTTVTKIYNGIKTSSLYKNINGYVIKVNKLTNSFVLRSFNNIHCIECYCDEKMDIGDILFKNIQVYGKVDVDYNGKLYFMTISKAIITNDIKELFVTSTYTKLLHQIRDDPSCQKKIDGFRSAEEPNIFYNLAFIVVSKYDAIVSRLQSLAFGKCRIYKCHPNAVHKCLAAITEEKYFHVIFIIGHLSSEYDVIEISSVENVRALLNRRYRSYVITAIGTSGTKLLPLISELSNYNYNKINSAFDFIMSRQLSYKLICTDAMEKSASLLLKRIKKIRFDLMLSKRMFLNKLHGKNPTSNTEDGIIKLKTLNMLIKVHLTEHKKILEQKKSVIQDVYKTVTQLAQTC